METNWKSKLTVRFLAQSTFLTHTIHRTASRPYEEFVLLQPRFLRHPWRGGDIPYEESASQNGALLDGIDEKSSRPSTSHKNLEM